ncbi:rhamnulokinase [Anaerobacterium chartisolvens]|nr:rhamnulokinase family protein [Anaerobacterium chartisolvens]
MLAFDFGASSGRAMLGTLRKGHLEIREIHRFSNDAVNVSGNLHWDTLRLLYEIKQGILKCVNGGDSDIASIAIDTWGVDFGLLDERGELIGNPYHYRDKRTLGMMEKVFEIIPKEQLYMKTGIQLMELNTVFQLFSMIHGGSAQMQQAKTLLLTPDLFNYFLTGVKATEYSIASTTQLLDPLKKQWCGEIIQKLGIPRDIFTDIVMPGTVIGNLSAEICDELGVKPIPVIAAAGHDTQAAVASVPACGEDFAYISCGTWSLMGVETDSPILNDKSFSMSFTNEGGIDNKITFLKNIMGLWLIQECKRQWDREGKNLGFAAMESMAREAGPVSCFIDPDDRLFVSPGNMPERIKRYCCDTGQYVPQSVGEVVMCICQSLALKYRMTVESLEDVLGRKLPVIHMVGGGIKDKLLCSLTADVTGREVIAGPVEATSVGNLVIQAMALGKVKNLKEARRIVGASFPTEVFKPRDSQMWDRPYEAFKNIIR